MFYVATCLLFDKNDKLLIYLRDNKPGISFPNHWDLFGGIVEAGETPEEALVREIKEEIGIDLNRFQKFKDFHANKGGELENIKFVFVAEIDYLPRDLVLLDGGQKIISIDLADRHQYKFANILAAIVDDFALSKDGLAKN